MCLNRVRFNRFLPSTAASCEWPDGTKGVYYLVQRLLWDEQMGFQGLIFLMNGKYVLFHFSVFWEFNLGFSTSAHLTEDNLCCLRLSMRTSLPLVARPTITGLPSMVALLMSSLWWQKGVFWTFLTCNLRAENHRGWFIVSHDLLSYGGCLGMLTVKEGLQMARRCDK